MPFINITNFLSHLMSCLHIPKKLIMGRNCMYLVMPGGARDWTGTLYLLYQALVYPSLITELTYRIQNLQNKTTTVVVFTVSLTYSPESHLHIQKLYIYIYIYQSERRTYSDEPLLVCWPSRMRKITVSFFCTYTD